MGNVKSGNKRLMVTLPLPLIKRMEKNIKDRGLNLTKSALIQLALEKELESKDEKDGHKR